jgi:hypothetical protein
MEEGPNPPQPPHQAVDPCPLPRLLHTDTILGNMIAGVHHTFGYTMSILQPAIRLLCIPLIPIVFLFLLSLILTHISLTLSSAFAPFCHVPGMSYICTFGWTHPVTGGRGKCSGSTTKVLSSTVQIL